MSGKYQETVLDDFLKDEEDTILGTREKETVLSGNNLLIATVVARVTMVIPTTGVRSVSKGLCTTVTGGVGTMLGDYVVTCTLENAGGQAGIYRIEAPNGAVLGDLTVTQGLSGTGSFTDPQINLTITYDTAYNVIGDTFTISVTAGSKKLIAVDFNAVEGSQKAAGVLIADYDATDADKSCVAIVRDATLAKSPLVWRLEFTSGGTNQPAVGNILEGLTTTTSSCRILQINLTSGTWAGGTAAGTMLVDKLNADLAAEPMRIVGGSPTSSEYFTTAKDRTFTGGSTNWADGDMGTTFHETDDLTLVADATGQYCKITFTNIGTALVSGERYRLQYDFTNVTAGFEFKLTGATGQTLGDAVPGISRYIDFAAVEAYATSDELRIYSKTAAAASGSFDNFSLKKFDDLTVAATDIAGAFTEMEALSLITREEA